MIEKITYIAFDGKEFETKETCLAHEENLPKMNKHVQLLDADFSPIEWTPGDYERMWDELVYIVIDPHHEEEAEEWWNNSFCKELGVSPFREFYSEWKLWKKTSHDDKHVVLVYGLLNSGWEIFNNVHAKVNKIADTLF